MSAREEVKCSCGHEASEHGEAAEVCDSECSVCDCREFVSALTTTGEPDPVDLRRAIERVLDPRDQWRASTRLIQCTPTFGAYGAPAFWILVLDGSPPKATVVVQSGWNQHVIPEPGYPSPIRIASDGTYKKTPASAADPLNTLLRALRIVMNADRESEQIAPPLLDRPRAFTLCTDGSIVGIHAKKEG